MRWMSFGSLRRWLPLLLPAAEAAWLLPWVLLLSGVFYPRGGLILAPGPVVGLLVGGYLLGSAPAAGRWPMLWTRLGVLASGLLLGLWAVGALPRRYPPTRSPTTGPAARMRPPLG